MLLDSKRDLGEFLRKQFVKISTALVLDNRIVPVSIVTDDHLQAKSILCGRAFAGGSAPAAGAGTYAATRLVGVVDCVVEQFLANQGSWLVTDDSGSINARYTAVAPWTTFQTGDRKTPAVCFADWGSVNFAITPAGLYAGGGTIQTPADAFIPAGSFAFIISGSQATQMTVNIQWREPK